MKEMYITVTGMNHYYGSDFLKKGMKIKLEKEPTNEHDKEAIMAKVKGLGKVGYVGNSPYTVVEDSMSAGRIYDKIGNKAKAKVIYILAGGAVCKITKTGLEEKVVTVQEETLKEE